MFGLQKNQIKIRNFYDKFIEPQLFELWSDLCGFKNFRWFLCVQCAYTYSVGFMDHLSHSILFVSFIRWFSFVHQTRELNDWICVYFGIKSLSFQLEMSIFIVFNDFDLGKRKGIISETLSLIDLSNAV